MIKVRAGQVWTNGTGDNYIVKTTHLGPCNKGVRIAHETTGKQTVVAGDFDHAYKFVPQNDLERMAIDTPEWHWGDHCFYRYGGMVTKENHTKIFKSEWQNMRYHLGQDKKPHYRLTGGEWVKQ